MSTKLRSKSKAEFELQNLMTLSHDKLTLKHRRNLSQVHPKPMEVNKRKGINQVEADDFKLDDASFKSEMEQTVFVAESFKDFGDKSKSYKSVQINEDDSNAKESQNYSNTLGLFTSRDDHHNANNSTAKNSLSYDFLDRIIKSEKESDNDYETNECFLKLKVLEFNCSLYTLISIGSGVLYYELKQYGEGFKAFKDNKQLLDASITFTLLLVSIGVILFILTTIMRYLVLIRLNKSTGKITKATTVFNKSYIIGMSLEILFALIHPNLGLKDVKYTTDQTWYLISISYHINDFLLLLLLARVYVIFRFFISLSKFYNTRSARVAKLIGSKLTRIFAIRCIVEVYPYTFLAITGSILTIVLSLMLRIVESPVYNLSEYARQNGFDYRLIQNCVWNILVTMTTVGYGDYVPLTNLGRLINILAAITGTILISLMVISLQNAVKLSDYEERAYEMKEKSELTKEIEKRAGLFFKASFDYMLLKKQYRMALQSSRSSREIINTLRKKVERTLYRKIDQGRRFKRMIQTYRNTYELPTESDVLKTKLDAIQVNSSKVYEHSSFLSDNIREINMILDKIEIKASGNINFK